MWLKNLTLYRLPAPWPVKAEDFERKLAAQPLTPCGSFQMESRGWTSPRADGYFLFNQNFQWLLALGIEQKLLPGSVIRQVTEERAAELALQQAHPVGRKQMRDLREQVTTELMPKALSRRKITHGWIDEDELPALRLETQRSPASAMAEWLSKGDAPGKFTLDQDLELRAPDASKATVRYTRHPLEGREIRDHLSAGKTVVQLGLTWNDRISFLLTEHLQVKRLTFLDILKREDGSNEDTDEDEEEKFEIDFALMTGELGLLLADLVAALGGEKER
ncbi:MAG: recombination-associated protein RdgC [Proteobacteria bacterium]|nr:recombination-associated protein RdgC [Pseudomonadota bacterium]